MAIVKRCVVGLEYKIIIVVVVICVVKSNVCTHVFIEASIVLHEKTHRARAIHFFKEDERRKHESFVWELVEQTKVLVRVLIITIE